MMMVDLLNRVSGSTSIAHTILIRLRLAESLLLSRLALVKNLNKNFMERESFYGTYVHTDFTYQLLFIKVKEHFMYN